MQCVSHFPHRLAIHFLLPVNLLQEEVYPHPVLLIPSCHIIVGGGGGGVVESILLLQLLEAVGEVDNEGVVVGE